MKMLLAIVPVVCCFIAIPCLGDQPKESIAGIWRLDQGGGTQVRVVLLGDTPAVPPDVAVDLEEFNASLADVPEELTYIATSRNGRAFGVSHASRQSPEPTGVWVWPNWRDATPVVFEQFSYFGFHSNVHVYLQYEVPGTRGESRVAKITEPDIIYSLPGVIRRHLRILDDGRWVATAMGTGQLITGTLDPQHPNAGADVATTVPVEFDGSIENLAWVRGGEFLVVDIKNGNERDLKVIDAELFDFVDSTNGQMPPSRPSYLDDERFFAYHDDERKVLRILASGQILWEADALEDNDSGAAVSPSGQFALTYWRPDFDTTEAKIRKTHLASPEVSVPTWPQYEVDDEKIIAGRYFWLTWEPE